MKWSDGHKTQSPDNILSFEETRSDHRGSQLPSFKHHQESSTVELFYDLFFVANLATFTANYEIVDVGYECGKSPAFRLLRTAKH